MNLSFKESALENPIYFHRDYEKDFKSKDKKEVSKVDSSWTGIAQRTAFASLPFFSLYKPFGFPLALAMGSVRVLGSASELYGAVQKGDTVEISGQVLQTAIAVGALAGTIIMHPLGMLITTGQDTLLDAGYLIHALSERDYKAASERTLSLVNNALYLSLFFAGSLELSIASLGVQVISGLYYSAEDFRNDRWIEGTAHLLMGGIRANQLVGQVQVLQQKNEFDRKIKALMKQVKEAEKKIREEVYSEDTSNCLSNPFIMSTGISEKAENRITPHVKTQSIKAQPSDDVLSRIMKYKNNGDHALHCAVEANDLEIVRIFLDSGMNVNYRRTGYALMRRDNNRNYHDENYSPIEIAIKNNFVTMTSFLLERGADPYYLRGLDYFTDRRYQGYHDFQSAIYIAITQKNYDMLKMLSNKKINFEKPCHWQETGHQVALASGDKEIISIIFGIK